MGKWSDWADSFTAAVEAKPAKSSSNKSSGGGRGTIVEDKGARKKALAAEKAAKKKKDREDAAAKVREEKAALADERQRRQEKADKRLAEEAAAQKIIDDKAAEEQAAEEARLVAEASAAEETRVKQEKIDKAEFDRKAEEAAAAEKKAEESRVAEKAAADAKVYEEALAAKDLADKAAAEEAPTWGNGELEWSDIPDGIEAGIDTAKDAFDSVTDTVNDFVDSGVDTVKDFFKSDEEKMAEITATSEAERAQVMADKALINNDVSEYDKALAEYDLETGADAAAIEAVDMDAITTNSDAERAIVMSEKLEANTDISDYDRALAEYDLETGADTNNMSLDDAKAHVAAKEVVNNTAVVADDTAAVADAAIVADPVVGFGNQSTSADLLALQAADAKFNQQLTNQFQNAATAGPGTYQNLTGNPDMAQSGSGGKGGAMSNFVGNNNAIDTNRNGGYFDPSVTARPVLHSGQNDMQRLDPASTGVSAGGPTLRASMTTPGWGGGWAPAQQYLNQSGTDAVNKATGGK